LSPAIIAAAFAFGGTLPLLGGPVPEGPQPGAPNVKRSLLLTVFVRPDSQRCQEAASYARSLVQQSNGRSVRIVDVQSDQEGLAEYWRLVERFRVEKPVLPAFYTYDRLKLGFSSPEKSGTEIADLFILRAYTREGCQHCRDAKRFLAMLADRWPGIVLEIHDVQREPGAKAAMTALAKRHGITVTTLPVISVCGRVITGFQTDATTGKQIEGLLLKASTSENELTSRAAPAAPVMQVHKLQARESVHPSRFAAASTLHFGPPGPIATDKPTAIEQEPTSVQRDKLELPPVGDDQGPPENTYVRPTEVPEGIDLPWFGYVRVSDLGMFAFTVLIGLVDGFNPCAMWVLVFLLSVLANIKDRTKIAAIAGTFVVVSGLAYFAFMAAWLNLFLLVGMARPLQIALGGLAVLIGLVNIKDFFAFKQGVTLSIPESAKPGIYDRVRRIAMTRYLSVAIGLSVVLAVLVNVVEILCTAGLPALYTQILAVQQLPAWKNYAYLGLYNLAYMFDDSIMVSLFVATLSHRKMREAEGRWLKLVSGLVVLGLGLVMLFRPDWLQW
jgi:glutaredoxin